MADKKISQLTNLTGANLADDDEFVLVDTSADETKAITYGELKKFNSIDINGGTIDGTVIGGTTPAAGSFTTVTADGLTVATSTYANTFVPIQDLKYSTFDVLKLGYTGVTGSIRTGTIDTGAFGFAVNTGDGSQRIKADSNGDISFYEDTGTTPKFFWDASAERLGLGTSSPTNDLNVSSTSSTKALFERTGSTGAYIGLKDSSGSVVYLGDNNGTFEVQTAGSSYSTKLAVTSAGNVGIGTSSPASKLSVSGGASGVATDIDYSGGIVTGTEYSALRFTASGLGFVPVEIRGVNTNGGQNLGVMQMFTSGSERMRIDSTGNVGIGTSSPSQPLHVSGNIRVGTTSDTVFSNNFGSISSSADLAFLSNSNTVFKNTSGTERMRITNTGNVGIGTTSPARTLSVNGAAGFGNGIIETVISFSDRGIIGTQSNHALELRTNGSERLRIDSSGHAIIPAGVTLGTAAGVYNAANTLDDYEEGTWTPTLVGHTTAGSYTITPATGSATYVKVGKIVHVAATMTITVNSAGTGLARFGGLPFTSAGNTRGMGPVRTSNVSLPASTLFAVSSLWTSNTTDFSLSCTRDNASLSTLDVSGISSGDVIDFRMTYETT